MVVLLLFRECLSAFTSIKELNVVARIVRCVIFAALAGVIVQTGAFAQTVGAERVHVVASGDTLSDLAVRYGTTIEALVRANNLASRDFLRVGQQLVIMGTESANPQVAQVHTVMPGDTLTAIALEHGVLVESIAALNGVANPNRISVGQTLKIPDRARNSPESDLAPSSRGAEAAGREIQLVVRYRSQFTGSPYEESDCGPATLGMLLSANGKEVPTASLRQWVMESTRYWGYDGGSDWKSLVYAARKAGFQTDGLYNPSGGYRKWSLEEIEAQLESGKPVMLLVRYRALPGHTGDSWWGDHYIIIFGMKADGQFIYHDSAFKGEGVGANRVISRDTLRRAWSTVSEGIQYSATGLKE